MHTQDSPFAALALSYREAARLLRVDRATTLHDLIDHGFLTPIPWGKRQRIPLEQIQQLARTGFSVAGEPSVARSRPRRASPTGRIRDLEIEP